MKSNYCPVTGKSLDCKKCTMPEENGGFCSYMEWDILTEKTLASLRKRARKEILLEQKQNSPG